ncbi:hypothetical protein AYI70_g688 [Smittium culicis]|uniref:Uncharacterized protein n=1 Tax=Smittium culicis TaxID=133412 RepID=A0A1R1YFR4_9FUNG|nr:hypothetical protein AYI70_g688 [Smittium culicis]
MVTELARCVGQDPGAQRAGSFGCYRQGRQVHSVVGPRQPVEDLRSAHVQAAAQLLHGEASELHGHQPAGRFSGGYGPNHNGVEGRAEAEGEEPVPLALDALAAGEHAKVCPVRGRSGGRPQQRDQLAARAGLWRAQLRRVRGEPVRDQEAAPRRRGHRSARQARMSSADKIELEKKKLQAKLKRSTASGRNEQQPAENSDGDSDPSASASASASYNGDDGELRKRARGRNSSAKRKLRKTQKNVIDLKKLSALNQVGKQEKIAKIKAAFAESSGYELDGPLSKFYKEKINREFS